MQFGTGISGSVIGSLYGGGTQTVGSSAAPAASSGPTGRPSLMAAAWGTDSSGNSNAGLIAGLVGLAAWAGLAYLWWVLPR